MTTRARRLALRVAAVAAATVLSSVIVALPASADLCATAPAPASPKSGLPGMFTEKPASIPPSAADPFADPNVPLGEVYGYNWTWSNYDLGCGSDFLRDPSAVVNTNTANLILSVAGAGTASLATIEHMATGTPMDWLSEPFSKLADSLKEPVFSKWMPVALGILALSVAWAAKRASYQQTARVFGITVVSIALATFALFFPVILSTNVDKVLTATSTATGTLFSSSPVDTVNRESDYRTWLQGNFGDADSKAAQTYGPRLLAATHYTWSDWQRIQQAPDARKSIDEAKATDFTKIANSLKTEDPAAYETFAGRGERVGPALFGVVSVTAMGLFVGIAAGMVLVARVMMQVLTLVAPLAAVVALLPRSTGALARLWDLFTACIVAVAKFTLAAGVMTIILGAVQAADLSGVARLFWVIVVTIVGLVLTNPAKAFKTLIPGLDPNTSYLKKLVSHVGPALAGGAGSYLGVSKALDDSDKPEKTEQETFAQQLEPAPSLAALPSPTYTVTQQSAAQPAHAPAPEPLVLAGLPAPEVATEAPKSLPGAVPAAPTPALDAAPADQPTGAYSVHDNAPLDYYTTPVPVIEARDLPARLALEAAPAAAVPPPTVEPTPSAPEPRPDEVIAVEPTGIITQTDPGLYHSGPTTDEYLVPVTTREITEDGQEYERVVYHSRSV